MRYRPQVLFIGAAALGIGVVAFTLGADSGALAAGPERPHKVNAPFIARDEGFLAPSPSPSPVATPTTQPAPTAVPVPPPGEGTEINLQPQLDTAHAVSKLVTVLGGATLTTTGADGSRYTLTLPVNSVLFDVTVTMTPLKALGGLAASGGLKAGVQLEPDGMSLGVSATLDIVPANPVPVTEEISFSYSGNGHQAYGYGLGVNASRSRFTIMHFSGWAIGGGTAEQRAAMFQSQVDSARNRISQRLAPIFEAERQRQLLGTATDEGSAEFFEAIQRGLEEAYRDVVQPAMDTAEALTDAGGIDAVEPGVQAFLAWERELQLLKLDILRAEREALSQQMERIMDKLRLKMRDRCFNQHDLSMAARLMGLAREFALLGRGDAVAAQALEDAQKCLTFELDFEFVLTTRVLDRVTDATWESHVRALGVPVSLGFGAIVPVAQPLELLSYTFTSPGCGFSTNRHVTKLFRVNAGRLVFSTKEGKTELTDVELYIEPGDVGGSDTVTCGGDPSTWPTAQVEPIFHFMLHPGDLDRALGGVRVVNWDMIRGSVFARKTYSQTVEIFTERTVFTLRHAPE